MDIDVLKSDMGGGVSQVKWTGHSLFSLSRKVVRKLTPWGQSKNMSLINLKRAGFIELGIKEYLFKVAHEQIGIGGGPYRCPWLYL